MTLAGTRFSILIVVAMVGSLLLPTLVAPALAANGDDPDLALFNPERGKWQLRYGNGTVDEFFYGTPGDTPLMGDWDCDGIDTVAMYRESNGFIYLRNTNDFGVGEVEFFYGIKGDIPIAGDWDGDGCDTFGIYRGATVFLSNQLGTRPADVSFFFGIPGDRPFAGDFNGDGMDTVGLYRQSSGFVYFADTIPAQDGVAPTDNSFFYGIPSDRIVPGDWDDDGDDTVGIFRPGDRTFYLSWENRQGVADVVIPFGEDTWLPATGNFGPSPCDAAYPGVCIPSPPPDLNCSDIAFTDFTVLQPDPHGFDADNDGVGCETLGGGGGGGGNGTLNDPFAFGSTARIGAWDISVLSVEANATASVMAENQFNDPPAPGNQFFMAEVQATFRGSGSSLLFRDIGVSSVGQSSVAYDYGDSCGVIPDQLDDFREVFTGGTIVGNECWEIAAGDANTMVLIVDDDTTFTSADRFYFALPAGQGRVTVDPGSPPLPSPGPAGSRGNPYPLGTTTNIGSWDLSVLAVTPNATGIVLAENQFNDPPAPGHQFFMAEVQATFRGTGSSRLFSDVGFGSVGPNAVVYDSGYGCGVTPDELDDFREVFTGGTITGQLCWEIAEADVASLRLIAADDTTFDADDRAFLDLPPTGQTAVVDPGPPPLPEPGGPPGTRGNPLPAGSTGSIGGWDIQLLSVTPDATAVVLAENQFNDPPRDGHQFFIAEVRATYRGPTFSYLLQDLGFGSVGNQAVVYDIGNGCGVIPNELDEFVDVFTNGTISGNLCWEIRSSDAASLLLMVDDETSFDAEARLFLAS